MEVEEEEKQSEEDRSDSDSDEDDMCLSYHQVTEYIQRVKKFAIIYEPTLLNSVVQVDTFFFRNPKQKDKS